MKKNSLFLIFLMMLFSHQIIASEPSDYQKEMETAEYLYDITRPMLPGGTRFSGVLSELFLDRSAEPVYALVATYTEEDEQRQNQFFIYEWVDGKAELVWKSDYFPGLVVEILFDDIDGNGRSNLNPVVFFRETRSLTFYAYDWAGPNSRRIFPLATEYGAVAYGRSIRMLDYDKDGIIEVIVDKASETEVRKQFYELRGQQLVLELEEVDLLPSQNNQLQSTQPLSRIAMNYPDIHSFIVHKYPSGNLVDVIGLHRRVLYLATFQESPDGSFRHMVFEKQKDTYKLWYEIDHRFDGTLYSWHYTDDLNDDGFVELFLATEHSVWKSKYHILQIKPSGYNLISPVDENGQPKIALWNGWREEPEDMYFYDCNNDGKTDIETYSGIYDSDGYEVGEGYQQWLWSDTEQLFVKGKSLIWDEASEDYVEYVEGSD